MVVSLGEESPRQASLYRLRGVGGERTAHSSDTQLHFDINFRCSRGLCSPGKLFKIFMMASTAHFGPRIIRNTFGNDNR
jgi:hypothetical protein